MVDLPKLHELDLAGVRFLDDALFAAWLPCTPTLRRLHRSLAGVAGCHAIAKRAKLEAIEIADSVPSAAHLAAILGSKSIRDLSLFEDSTPEQLELDGIATQLLRQLRRVTGGVASAEGRAHRQQHAGDQAPGEALPDFLRSTRG